MNKIRMFLGSLIILAVGILGTQNTFADHNSGQVMKEAWVARYNGPVNSEDIARALAIDSQDNVYVTGESIGNGTDRDYATVKYDTNGNQLWEKRYNGFRDSTDYARALVIDNQGNVYVTGVSEEYEIDWDYATVKYDSNGNQLWVARYNGDGNDYDGARALAIDSQGNVYVTGSSRGNETNEDYATIKYDTNGNQLWEKRYNGSGNGDDAAYALAIDSQDNVYVTGLSFGDGTSYYDYATVKYDPNGNQLWEKRYNGSCWSSYDQAYALALDSQGNVYVTGESCGDGTNSDYATIKYDPNGNQLWEKRYNDSVNSYDQAYALAIDSQDNVYVTGKSEGSGTSFDYATVKYDSNGNQLWEKRYNGPGHDYDDAYALAIDSRGNVYVTGESYGNGTDYDYATVKYDTNGNQLWETRYNGSGNRSDSALALAIDSQDNVYVTGASVGNGTNSDYTTVKYLQLPTVSVDLNATQSGVKLGGVLSYDLTLTNNSTESQTINYWAEVKHSNGNPANKFDASSFTLTLDPGEVTTTTIDQAVPRIIPFGQYEYTGNVGETTTEAWDSETFNFTVTKPRVMGWNP